MSAIRYFEEVPHIVRYGMQDDKDRKSWMSFWRCGVGFILNVNYDDVRDTPFSKPWLEFLKEPHSLDDHKNWVQRWEALCDCKIAQCLPLLKTLAPDTKHWETLDDYIHTPSYDLKMVTDPTTKDAIAEITEGPKDKPAYETWPTAAANIKHLPEDVVRYHAKDLLVLREEDWRAPPDKVRSPDGQVFSFKACEKTARFEAPPKDTIVNWSLDIINTYSRLFNIVPSSINLRRLEGVVVTDPSADITDSSPGVDWKDDPRTGWEHQQHQDTQLVAGVLMTYIPDSKSLKEWLQDAEDKPTAAQRKKWKKQIGEVIGHLHGIRTTVGGHVNDDGEVWYYINQYAVKIAGGGESGDCEAWLDLGQISTTYDASDQDNFEQGQSMDWKGLEKTFDFPCEVTVRESLL